MELTILALLTIALLLLKFFLPNGLTLLVGSRRVSITWISFGNWLGIVSLWVAIEAYRDAQKSGPEQQKALEGSRQALQSVVSELKNQRQLLDTSASAMRSILRLNAKQYALLDSQQMDQERRQAQKAKFSIDCKFRYFDPPSQDSVFVSASAIDFGIDAREYFEATMPEGTVIASKFLNEYQLTHKVFPVELVNTRTLGEFSRYFYLVIRIRNTGTLNSDGMFITINPLQRGVRVSGDGISASEPKVEQGSRDTVYSGGIKNIPLLTQYRNTKEEIRLTLQVITDNNQDIDLRNKIIPVEIGVGDRNVPKKTVLVRFKVVARS